MQETTTHGDDERAEAQFALLIAVVELAKKDALSLKKVTCCSRQQRQRWHTDAKLFCETLLLQRADFWH